MAAESDPRRVPPLTDNPVVVALPKIESPETVNFPKIFVDVAILAP